MKVQCPHCSAAIDVTGLNPDSIVLCGNCSKKFKLPPKEFWPEPETPTAGPVGIQIGPNRSSQSGSVGGQRGYYHSYAPGGRESSVQAGPRKPHPNTLPALILAIVSFLCCGFLASVPAALLAWQAMEAIDREPNRWEGRGNAKTAFVIAVINIVLSLAFFFSAYFVPLDPGF